MIKDNSLQNLRDIFSKKKKIIFVGIGNPKLCMDAFGPKLGTMLKNENYIVYGTEEEPITRPDLKEKLKEIKRKHAKDYIIAIDAAITNTKPTELELGEIIIKKEGLKPASYYDKKSKMFGDASIKMMSVVNYDYLLNDMLEKNTEEIFKLIKQLYPQ